MDNWKFIIPTAIGLWLLLPRVLESNLPPWAKVSVCVAAALLIAGLVGFLLVRQTAWFDLAQRYPARLPVSEPWRWCRTAVLSRAALDAPTYEQEKVRLHSILRVAATHDALNLAAIPVFRPLIPPVQIPWSAIAHARAFDGSGWIQPPSNPGAFFQLSYDPGSKGRFAELELTDPRLFIQLPAEALGSAWDRLPLSPEC